MSQTATAAASATDPEQPIAGVLRGLLSGTVYRVRVVASNATGTSTGAPATFRTPPGPPRVAYAVPAAKRVDGTVVLRALVTAAGAPTRVWFRYRDTRTPAKRIGAAAQASLVVARVPAAAAGDRFQVVAANAKGRASGGVRVVPG